MRGVVGGDAVGSPTPLKVTFTHSSVTKFNKLITSPSWAWVELSPWSAVGALSGVSRCLHMTPRRRSHNDIKEKGGSGLAFIVLEGTVLAAE